jgi:NAD(P)-dependent dehydrogenase (short-subunit alcohol dehydrogenase family)
MSERTWLITGVSSGFGRHLTEQLLERGDRVVGTVRKPDSVAALTERYPDRWRAEILDVRDTTNLRAVVDRTVTDFKRIDVVVSNAGYALFGAAEELIDEQIEAMIATNLTASIQLARAVLPHMRAAGSGWIIQLSSYGGQVVFPGNSMYHATKWGIEGFMESIAQEVAPFGIGVTIVEPGGARTEFRGGSAQIATPMPECDDNPAHAFRAMLDPSAPPAPGDPARMAARIIESVELDPAPLCVVLGAPRPLTAPSARSASGSPTSSPRPGSPPPRTSHLGSDRLAASYPRGGSRGRATDVDPAPSPDSLPA